MREGDALPHTSTFERVRIGGGRRARPRWPWGGRPVRGRPAVRIRSRRRMAGEHVSRRRSPHNSLLISVKASKARDARRSRRAALAPPPDRSVVGTRRPWSDRPSRASPSVGAARAPDRERRLRGRRSYDGRRLRRAHSDAHETYKRRSGSGGRHPRAGRVPGATGSGITGTTCVVPMVVPAVRPCPQKRPL